MLSVVAAALVGLVSVSSTEARLNNPSLETSFHSTRTKAHIPGTRMHSASLERRRRGFKYGVPEGATWTQNLVTNWWTAQVDTLSFQNNATFPLRYLSDETYVVNGKPDVVLFYSGNEGDIYDFANNTQVMPYYASQLNAEGYSVLALYVEHRYFGLSQPEGPGPNYSYKYLTINQALNDFASFVYEYKNNNGLENVPFITFGGSYGGMLSYYLRVQFPSLFNGAIAASAPLSLTLANNNCALCDGFNNQVSIDFYQAEPNSPFELMAAWDLISNLGNSAAGRAQMSAAFNVCGGINNADDVDTILGLFQAAATYEPMLNYCDPSTLMQPLPAYPMNLSASFLNNGPNAPTAQILQDLNNAFIQVYYNYTGSAGSCFNLTTASPTGDLSDANAWDYLACSSIIEAQSQLGNFSASTLLGDIFPYAPYSQAEYYESCIQQFPQVVPNANALPFWFPTTDISGQSNTVLSNGMVDPWHRQGVVQNQSNTYDVIVLPIVGGAHHSDLRGPTPNDPPTLTEARLVEYAAIKRWIAAYQNK